MWTSACSVCDWADNYLPIMIGVPWTRKWDNNMLPTLAMSEPLLQWCILQFTYSIKVCVCTKESVSEIEDRGKEGEGERERGSRRVKQRKKQRYQPTPSRWLRQVLTSNDPIHSFDPTREASLSPTSTNACWICWWVGGALDVYIWSRNHEARVCSDR